VCKREKGEGNGDKTFSLHGIVANFVKGLLVFFFGRKESKNRGAFRSRRGKGKGVYQIGKKTKNRLGFLTPVENKREVR